MGYEVLKNQIIIIKTITMYTFYFEKLEVWQNARKLVKEIYKISRNFPDEERFGITNQIRRASTSITANIAEGVSRNTNKDKSKFINIAYSTSIEVINFLILSWDLDFISEEKYIELREKTELITNQLNSFYKSLE
ncbi:four helix bundle protein [Cloacibacterium rupense]|uniref:Four helix bundle protein n=2 Tax=Weeksellaceae TaxID=2762318 RepID=A0ABQ2NJU0_9FLAO|nr:four helix bundle protein [Cloacibacterium rupense]